MEPNAKKLCPSCQEPNDDSNRYCTRCGFDFGSVSQPFQPQAAPCPPGQDGASPCFSDTAQSSNPVVEYQMQMFYGGVHPDTMIEDISAKELAWYIKDNAKYYLPVFAHFASTGSKVRFNFASFFLSGGWLLFRRQVKSYLLLMLATIVMALPNLVVSFVQGLQNGLGYRGQGELYVSFNISLNLFTFIASLAIAVVFGLFGNYLYYRHCLKQIRSIRAQAYNSSVYWSLLSQKGGTRIANVFIAIAIAFASILLLSFIIGFVAALILTGAA